MKIKEIRTRVVEWRGRTVALPPHFCTNPMDLLALPEASMRTFTFHGWLVVEVMSDDGHVGVGNAALAPRVTKQVIDLYLKPLLIGADPWDVEFLWQHMYRKTMAFGRKGIGMTAISAVDIALWDLMGKSAKQPVFRLLGGRTKPRIPVYASRLYSTALPELAAEARRYKDEGYKAMKLRFGWGPVDGAAGMQRNVELVRTVRETVGDEVDVMADAYMGWTLDYAKRMLPLPSACAGSRRPSFPTRSTATRSSRPAGSCRSPGASTSSRSTASRTCCRRARSTTSSSTRTAWAGSRRRARSRHSRRRTACRSSPTPGRCTTTTW